MKYLLLLLTFTTLTLHAKVFGLEFTGQEFTKEYYAIKDIKKRKKVFMEIIHPLIMEAQRKILLERDFVKLYFSLKGSVTIPAFMQRRMEKISKKYKIKKDKRLISYLKRIDIIHEPLVLAQAAVESAWGTSRFTKLANNIFGEWTWGKRGIIPAGRPKGKKYKIRIFDTLQESVDSYMLNLNRHYRYTAFREARYAKRKEGKCFEGKEASNYLQAYSAIGDKYAKMLKGVMRHNKMCEYSLLKEAIEQEHNDLDEEL